jgi:UDPglucose 6-dehydrogenase
MHNLGIIGRGFVGSAVEFGFSPQTGCDIDNMYIYDKVKSKSLHSLEDVVLYSDIIFLSVPTPSNEDGSINLSYVEDALQDISEITAGVEESMVSLNNIILVRSTVTPGTTERLQQMFQNLNLVFNPEFLTERSANFDFINQTRFILGGDKKHTNRVADLYRWRFGETIPVIETNYQTAELIKYMNNCFFATKVSFLNEMRQVSDLCGADWNMAVEGFIRDGRIGHSHMNVPGPDGKFGFGGKCFPKDVSAMIDFGNKLGLDMHTLSGVWDTNCEVRPEKDWENNASGVAWEKSEQLEIPFSQVKEKWVKEYTEHGNKYTLEDVEMIQEGVRQYQSDKE